MPVKVNPLTASGAVPLLVIVTACGALTVPCGTGEPTDPNVSVLDPANHPIAGALVQLSSGSALAAQATTDAKGHARFSDLKAGYYNVAAGKTGYIAVEKRDIDLVQEVAGCDD